MVDKTPAQITPGNANDNSVVHASDATLSDLSRSHTERDISRLQGTAPLFQVTQTYIVNDLVTESNIVYRNIVPIPVPGAFNPADWQAIQTPWTSDIDAAGFNLLNVGYVESNAANPADSGTLRLGNNEAITARNAGDTANLAILFDSDDNISTSSPINGIGGNLIFKSNNTERFRLTTSVVDFTAKIQTDSTTTTAGYRDFGFTADPSSPNTGDLYFNTTTNKYRSYNGATWDELGAVSQTPWTSDIDGDTFNLLNIGYLEQNEITEPADPAAGLLRLWSESDAGFSLLRYKGSSGFVNTISQDVFVPVRNVSGVTLLKGKVVYVTGAQGQRVTVDLARADADSTMRGIGFMLEDLPNNSNGYVIVAGTERDINTNAFSAGDTLYVSETTAGEVTATPPTHPNISQVIGFVLVSNPTTGEINVIPGDTNGQEEGTNKNTYLIGDGLAGVKELGYVDNVGTQSILVDNTQFHIDLLAGTGYKVIIGGSDKLTGDATSLTIESGIALNFNGLYTEWIEQTEPATPAAGRGRFWLDPAVIVNDKPRFILKDEDGVNHDLTSAGMVCNTYNTEAIGNNHYLALSGLNSSNGTFINRAIVLPRATRFYNLYCVVTQNGTTIVTNIALNDGAASPTILDIDIPIGTTGTFANTDDFVDLLAATECAYGFGLTTGGTLAIASVGMAMDHLRLEGA